MPDVVLTGLPRSGSTLICHLLNRCADTVALNEPIPVGQLAREHGVGALPAQIEQFFASTRQSLLTERRATSKLVEGKVPDNTYGTARTAAGDLRRSLASRGEVRFPDKDLSADFVLAVKHNTSFAALLDRLVTRFPCYGIVRHPLAALASWNSVEMPVQDGFLPVLERIEPALHAELGRIPDRTERQFRILGWFFERFLCCLPRPSILRYEDLIASGGRSLAVVTPGASALGEPLESKNRNAEYDPARILELGEKLLARDGAYWEFYTRDSVEEMLAPLRGHPQP